MFNRIGWGVEFYSNMKGFWDQLIALMDDLQARGMIRGDWHQYIKVANSLDDIKTLCSC